MDALIALATIAAVIITGRYTYQDLLHGKEVSL